MKTGKSRSGTGPSRIHFAPGGCPAKFARKAKFILESTKCMPSTKVHWETWAPNWTYKRLPCWYRCKIFSVPPKPPGGTTQVDLRDIAVQAREGVVWIRGGKGPHKFELYQSDVQNTVSGPPLQEYRNGFFKIEPSVVVRKRKGRKRSRADDGPYYALIFQGKSCSIEGYDDAFCPMNLVPPVFSGLQIEDGYPPPGAPGAIN